MEQTIISFILSVIDYFNYISPLIASFLIIIESIIPILPLSIFIAINVISFGLFIGFIISYIATIIGCLISFSLVRYVFKDRFNKRVKENSRIYHFMKKINKLKFSSLVLIIAMPFTPAFLINICAALSNMSYRKFFYSILIGKMSIIYFWGFVGDSLLEAITNIMVLLELSLLMIITFIISKIVTKKFKIE